jgi:hypothetical protein
MIRRLTRAQTIRPLVVVYIDCCGGCIYLIVLACWIFFDLVFLETFYN